MMIILTLPNCLQWPFFNKVYCHFTGNIYRNVRNKTNPLENVGKKLEQDVADDEKIMQLRSSLCLHQLYSLAFRIISILAGSAYLLPLIEDDYQDYFSYMCKLIQIRHKSVIHQMLYLYSVQVAIKIYNFFSDAFSAMQIFMCVRSETFGREC